MLNDQQKEQFRRDGYLLVPGILSAAQVGELRQHLIRLFDAPPAYLGDVNRTGGVPSVRFDICTRYPELRWLLVHPPALAVLRSLLGQDFLFLPEMSAHDSGFGDWHTDTFSQERAGDRYHRQPDYLMIEAAFYLQDNDAENGGGLDVIPGSHREPDKTLIDRPGFFDRAELAFENLTRAISIPSRAGDLVLFDFRLRHKATWPRPRERVPSRRKLAIFFACSVNNEHARSYTDFIRSREDYVYLQGHEYPEELRQLARANAINLF